MSLDNPNQVFPAVSELPDLTAYERWLVQCFSRLENSRSVGMAAAPIPLSEVTNYCDRLDEDEDFIDIMLHADSVVMELEHSSK